MTFRSNTIASEIAATISVEAVQQWENQFDQLNERLAAHFKRSETKHHIQDYLQGLLSGCVGKTSQG